METSLLLTFTNLITMKKNFSLRIFAGAGLCLFLGLNASAQVKDANLTVDQTVDQYVTINKAVPFHVTPDAYFNPNYNVGGLWAVSSTFTWSSSAPLTTSFSSTTVINPDVTFSAVANHTLSVVETSADGCPDATPMQILVHVLAAPSFDFGGLADILNHCGDQAAMNVTFTIANNGADAVDGTGDYFVDWTYDVDNLLADKSTLDNELAGLDMVHTDTTFTTSGAKTLQNRAFPVLNNKVTRYTFTLDGINDAVSRQSDYIVPRGRNIANTTYTNYVPGADNTFVVLVLPAPTTGPIYHVPNL
jgi:hypothetical protein